MSTPEDKALELIRGWLDDVDPEEFMREFNSLPNCASSPTIGEWLDACVADEEGGWHLC